MTRYCTYFDRHYLTRGLALYRSLLRHSPPFSLHVLCLDDHTHRRLSDLALPGIHPLGLGELEAARPRLRAVRPRRSRIEYYFTLTPALISFLLDAGPGPLTYLDADLYFFAAPDPIREELGGGAVAIIPHRFPPWRRHLERHGVYNVGWVSFARDERARRCLADWEERCLEWCHDRVEDGKFGDQKYLDDWPARFEGVVVVRHRGANLAPWNVATHPLRLDAGRVQVGGDPLLFYHFHGLRRLNRFMVSSGLDENDVLPAILRRHVYAPYLAELGSLPAETARPLQRGALLTGLLRGNILLDLSTGRGRP